MLSAMFARGSKLLVAVTGIVVVVSALLTPVAASAAVAGGVSLQVNDFGRNSDGSASYNFDVGVSGFTGPHSACAEGSGSFSSCTLTVRVRYQDGTTREIDRIGSLDEKGDPFAKNYASTSKMAPVDAFSAELYASTSQGYSQQNSGWQSVRDSYPSAATVAATSANFSREPDGRLRFEVKATAAGFTQIGRPCQDGSSGYYDYCNLVAYARGVDGTTTTLGSLSRVDTTGDPASWEISGTVALATVTEFRVAVEGSKGSITTPWRTVDDNYPREASITLDSVHVDRAPSGQLHWTASTTERGFTQPGRICQNRSSVYGSDSCSVRLEAKTADGDFMTLDQAVMVDHEGDPTATSFNSQASVTKISAIRATLASSKSSIHTDWVPVSDRYPDAATVGLSGIHMSRSDDGSLSFRATASASGFTQTGRPCANGSSTWGGYACFMTLQAKLDNGTTDQLGRRDQFDLIGDPGSYEFSGTTKSARVLQVRAVLSIARADTADVTSPWTSVTDPYPEKATVKVSNLRLSRGSDGRLSYSADFSAKGFTQTGRVCEERSDLYFIDCHISLMGQRPDGSATEIARASRVDLNGDTTTVHIEGDARTDGIIGTRVELATDTRVATHPPVRTAWTSFTDSLATSQAGGGNPAATNCGCSHADPINTATGEYWHSATDLDLPGIGPKVALERTYSTSNAPHDGVFGYGSASNIDAKLTITGNGDGDGDGDGDGGKPSVVRIDQENGAQIYFTLDSSGAWVASTGILASLTQDPTTGSWTFTRKGAEMIVFNDAGRVSTFRDTSGNETTVRYSGTTATSIVGSGGRSIDLTWSNGHITKADDSAGRSVFYAYDSAGNLEVVRAVNSVVWKYTYDPSHYVTSITKPGGGRTENSYDSQHRVTDQRDPIGRVTKFAYTSDTTTITAPDGGVTTETYANGVIVKLVEGATTPAARSTLSEYDSSGNLVKQTDPRGNISTFAYDAAGNVLVKTDPLGRTTTNTYNRFNQVTSTTDGMGRTTSNTYDVDGNLLKSVSPSGRTQTWTRNADGTAATWQNAAGGVSLYTYNSAGQQQTVTDPNGRVTTTRYDSAGRIIGVTAPGVPEATRALDAAGRILSITDPRGKATATSYDLDGNIVAVEDPNSRTTSSTFDMAGQQLTTTDSAGEKTTFTYDPAGRLTSSTNPAGAVTSTTWTVLGQKASTTDAEGHTTLYGYDAGGNLTSMTAADGGVTANVYDNAGQLTTATDQLGRKTTYAYDAAGQQVSVTDPGGRVTRTHYTDDGAADTVTLADASTKRFTYDELGNVTSFTNPDGRTARYTFDDAGLRTGKTDVGGITTAYTYDSAGKVKTSTDGNGTVTTYSYDDNGNLQKVAAGSDAPATYSYDAVGNRVSMTDATGTSAYEYDADGRLTSETNGAGTRIGYGYDDAGNVANVRYPGGKTVDYTRNGSGQVTKVTDWDGHAVSFTYDAKGNLQQQTAGNGVTDTIGYDSAGQVTSMTSTDGADPLASFGYSYTASGEVASATTSGSAVDAPTQQYTYDALGQLTSSNATPYAATPAGSLTTSNGSTLTYNGAQQVTRMTTHEAGGAAAATSTFKYDGAGNRISSASGSADVHYGYDSSGSLNKVTGVSGDAISYTSNGDGLRTSRTADGSTVHLTWSTVGALPLLLDDGANTYIYGSTSTPVISINNQTGAANYLTTDLIGSPRLATDDAGTVTGTASYDAFGNLLGDVGSMPAIGYTGGLTDADTGLVYLRARSYDPTTGQFTTFDPAIDATGQPYAYAGNNPILNTDPTGLWWGSDAISNWNSGARTIAQSFSDFTVSPTGLAIGDALTHGWTGNLASFAVGFGDGASFGLTQIITENVAPDGRCIVTSNTGWYGGGVVTGVAATTVATAGDGLAVRGAIRAGAAAESRVAAISEARALAAAPNKNGLNWAARAFQKHGSRPGGSFEPLNSGPLNERNSKAAKLIDEILNDPNLRIERKDMVTEYFDSHGRGIRIGVDRNGKDYLGLLEP